MTPPAEPAAQVQRVLLTVFGCYATRDEYSTEHLLAVMTRLLGQPPCGPEALEAELRRCPFARVRGGNGKPLRWRFVNASSVRPPRTSAGPPPAG